MAGCKAKACIVKAVGLGNLRIPLLLYNILRIKVSLEMGMFLEIEA